MTNRPPISPRKQLNRRFALFLFSVLGVISLFSLGILSYLYNQEISDERSQASRSISLLLQSSLERAMLRRDLEGLRHIVHELGRQPDIYEVLILNPKGEVRFSSEPIRLKQSAIELLRPFCGTCFPQEMPTKPITLFTKNAEQREVLRTFNPVHNKPACTVCHGSVQKNPVNGVLIVDHNAAPIWQKSRHGLILLVIAGILILLFGAISSWLFMRKNVLRPIHKLTEASHNISQNNLNTRIQLDDPHEKDEMSHLANTFNHMAEHLQQSYRELQEREKFLQGLIDAIPDGVRVINRDYKIIAANRAFCEQSGFSYPDEICNRHCYEITYQSDQPCPPSLRTCPIHQIDTLHEKPLRFMETIHQKNGGQLQTEVYAAPLQTSPNQEKPVDMVVESIRDLEQSLQYSHEQKLSALGKLAAGVAHEIHNPLASIRIALQASDHLLTESTNPIDDAEGLRHYLQLVDDQVDQCLKVTHNLLKLGTLSDDTLELVLLNDIVQETLSLLQFEREQKAVELQLELSPDHPRILANSSDIRMIVMNLAQNAFHAMPDGGTLQIITICNKEGIQIRVEDTGVGIPDEILPQIFDPFFSRRVNHQGSGLGLTIARSLINKHEGTIEVAQKKPHGTIFILTFPESEARVAALAAPEDDAAHHSQNEIG